MNFQLKSDFKATGDQPEAIEKLIAGVKRGLKDQVLLGVTGSGKTFTMASVIDKLKRPTLVISHNKTLAAQLYQEFRDFFPKNAVSYFVSYYDYYQPEAYIPQTDTYIEKETEINEEIDKLRLAATTNLLTRKDTIIVASVSCIYNIGSPREYGHFVLELREGMKVTREQILTRLADLQYERGDYEFKRGRFRVRGESVDIFPAYEDRALRLILENQVLKKINWFEPISGLLLPATSNQSPATSIIYPAKHYLTDAHKQTGVFAKIRTDLEKRVSDFKKQGKLLEAHRLKQRVNYDLEMISEVGYVNGIENYSRYFDNRQPGEPPYTLLDYFNEPYGEEWLLFIDESHMTIPQLNGMYQGDRSRKQTLIDFGFRLPAALDNRPLTFAEFLKKIPQRIYVSATPADWEIQKLKKQGKTLLLKNNDRCKSAMGEIRLSGLVEQLIRPTGLADPIISIRPTKGQINNLIKEIVKRVKREERVLVTTLTKRMAEDLTEYLNKYQKLKIKNKPIRVAYLHSDIKTLERQDVLEDLRKGKYDVLVGINLLREGLDLPEVSLVAILDADKEGFLRSKTSLIQTMGRAARHVRGEVIMYADEVTYSMKEAIAEIERRRKVQSEYNKKHKIKPKTVIKPIRKRLVEKEKEITKLEEINPDELVPKERKQVVKTLEKRMRQAAKDLDFELAVRVRDKIKEIIWKK